ncbi:ras-related protein Rab-7L1-like [Periplaneta americana]|uniref:ras-related protein Rab-7L1-like n=1 Tax=Periplaneta americana TaxID=6978 RepID=UPI0037E9BDB2
MASAFIRLCINVSPSLHAVMSKKLVFWPRIGPSLTLTWEECRQYEEDSNETPDEGSEPESEAQLYFVPDRRLSSTLPEKLFKVLIVGDTTVGKTSFVQRYVQNTFRKDYKGTVGVDFALKVVKWSDSTTVKLQMWDIAGQERFTWMTRVYYKDSHGCLIMCDLSRRDTLENTIKWKNDVDSKCTTHDGLKIPCLLLANKCDVPDNEKKITRTEIDAVYKRYEFSGWTVTSAKDGIMVNECMRYLTNLMLQQGEECSESSENIKLAGPGSPKRRCC